MLRTAPHEADPLSLLQPTVFDAHVHHDSLIGVEVAVIDQGPKRPIRVAGRRWDSRDDRSQYIIHSLAGLAASAQHVVRGNPQRLFHLGDNFSRSGDVQVDLVEHGHDGQLVLHCQESIGHGLRLHALKGIDQQDGALAGGQAARNFIMKIHVAGRVDQIQLIALP